MDAPWQLFSLAHRNVDLLLENRYDVNISPPSILSIDTISIERLCRNCSQASLGGINLDSHQNDYGGGLIRSIPHTTSFNGLKLQFYISTDLNEQDFFEKWIACTKISGNVLNYYNDYIGTIKITPLNRHNKKTGYTYTFYEIYPISVSSPSFKYGPANDIARIDVELKFYDYEKTIV